MIFSVPRSIPLRCGDVIFIGTPADVGVARNPARSLAPGQVLETWIEGIGTMRNRCVRRAPVE
jgi:2-keto-4-pentenoate hydratase/2-oxohepta-3-ene-1,7-dioic acid hydratase in catechol pathway